MKILDRFSLEGRTAYVTGGGQGIGRAFCHALAEAGASVAVVDIQRGLAETVANELREKGARAIALSTDVTNEAQVAEMVETILGEWGSLTIGVNNAGMGLWKDSLELTGEEWRTVLRLNLDAVYYCCRETGRAMARNGYGKLINTASMSARIANTPQKQVAYNASKAGVVHLTRTLAAEWAPHGIRVNCISPGYTQTKLVGDLLETEEGKNMLPIWLEKIPLGRLATPEDLQGAVCFLAASVSDYMTGSDLLIDGGYCCW